MHLHIKHSAHRKPRENGGSSMKKGQMVHCFCRSFVYATSTWIWWILVNQIICLQDSIPNYSHIQMHNRTQTITKRNTFGRARELHNHLKREENCTSCSLSLYQQPKYFFKHNHISCILHSISIRTFSTRTLHQNLGCIKCNKDSGKRAGGWRQSLCFVLNVNQNSFLFRTLHQNLG